MSVQTTSDYLGQAVTIRARDLEWEIARAFDQARVANNRDALKNSYNISNYEARRAPIDPDCGL